MIKRGFFADMKKILTVILIFCIYVAVPAVITLSVNSDDSQGVSQENIYGPRVNVKYKNGTKSVSVNEFVTMVLAKRFESGDETETLKAMGIMIRTDILKCRKNPENPYLIKRFEKLVEMNIQLMIQ